MSKKYDIEVEYKVIELISIEADSIDEAEDEALEMLRFGVTARNIVGDESDEAEIHSSKEAV